MSCRDFQRTLIDRFESSSPATGSERAASVALASHLAACPECADFAERVESTRMLLERPANSDSEPRDGFSARVVASLPAPTDPLAWAAARLLPATTALALVLLGWCWLATPSPGDLWEQAGNDEVLVWALDESDDDG